MLPPPLLVAKCLKRKCEHPFFKLPSSKGKSQNMGSSMRGSVGSFEVLSSLDKPHLANRVTRSSTFAFKGKAHLSFDPNDLIGNTDVQEGSVKFENSSTKNVHADSGVVSK